MVVATFWMMSNIAVLRFASKISCSLLGVNGALV